MDHSFDGLMARADRDTTELRGDCPRETVDVLDAVSQARGITRTELVNQVLGKWASQQITEATLIFRVTRRNPLTEDVRPALAD